MEAVQVGGSIFWLRGRLLTEKEWGIDRRDYGWGDQPETAILCGWRMIYLCKQSLWCFRNHAGVMD